MSSNNECPSSTAETTSPSSASTPTRFKLRKIPPIPIRRTKTHLNDGTVSSSPFDDDASNENENDDDNQLSNKSAKEEKNTPIIMASSLGLNHIRTQSTPSLSPLRFSSNAGKLSNLGNNNDKKNGLIKEDKGGSSVDMKLKCALPLHSVSSTEPGKRIAWCQSKSSKYPSGPLPLNPAVESHHAAFARELQSPRFQAILRVTSGRKKKAPDVKSFSHELNSKGVKPFPVWKSRAFGHIEEVMVAIRAKFDKLKEEVDSDLGIFAGDLVGILEKTCDSHPEWRESLEDLLVIARQCSKMSPNEFWVKSEAIVQTLDDKRQELPIGIIKQAHTRLLFILTRCTRLVQFQKESGFEDYHILGLHQLSDLGVYPEQILEVATQDFSGPLVAGNVTTSEKQRKKLSYDQEQDSLVIQQEHVDHTVEVSTAKSVDSTTSSYKMSSWKKLPSAAEKNRKCNDAVDTPTKDKSESPHNKDDTRIVGDDNSEIIATPEHPASSETRRVPWGLWGEHHNVAYGNSMICRICEVEIPIVHVEEHSLICTIVDRCDLKGLTLNERLERVVDTLDKILESMTPKSTPGCDTPRQSLEVERMARVHEELDELSPKRNSFSRHCSEDMLDLMPDADNAFLIEDINVSPENLCEGHSVLSPEADAKTSSAGSLTPRSPLLTPRTSQIELLLTGRRTIMELENHQQISKLLEIARSVASINECDYSALECMLDRLEDLKYAIQDRKVDALVVETFGRRIEKLLQEKYVHLCAQIDDEKLDLSNHMADEESSLEDDAVRSWRASPINPSKDRTSIEDFEIIKPISRGAFGRVFLAKKRATGDLFAIKVLKKADMIRKNAVESILAERNILISVRNPFVVRFFYSFTCRENLYLVMEYLNGGDLYSLLRNLGCLDEDMARVYIAEVVLALEYLHSLSVIHRDLKPDNLLIGQDGHLKLTDFGLSKVGLINSTDDLSGPSFNSSVFFDDGAQKGQNSSKREQRQKHSVVGTPDYLAPEILLGTGHGTTADWWSVGIILFELLVGIPPFNAENPQQIFDNIMNRDIPWPRVPEEMSFEACDLIDKLLTENPLQRLGATGSKEVKQHSFFGDINWDTLARQKAMFIPAADAHDTSYFMSRYIWNPEGEGEHLQGGSDFDDLTDTCSTGSFSNTHDEDGDECGSLADFNAPALAVKYSFSNFSFKNLSQLASMNYDLVIRSAKEAADASKPSVP
ncbi:probable serine/threonine protein kinase IRE [Ricinus communis]|uniref:non-specific serine/threonine protein kinase n=1 Tax=Ricinus communis TaxID=3988 RepID=B9R9Q3_RICCO|nr:probable serine/threonine protein kinase IRE [Ricinus communis]EEF51530.1 kinase, putative [Ricinus communis]|eukprot:XP_002510928.1 probable serine/threonine protein kinase IRE isoform X2 [Ricinus communis]